MKYTYLLVNLFTIIVPFIFSFHPRIGFHKTWPAFFTSSLVVGTAFVIWDAVFTRAGVWSFNERYVTGVEWLGLPLEEFLFFICIPYACVFTYYCLDKFLKLDWQARTEKIFVVLFAIFLFVMGMIFIDRLYTSVTFISTAIVILVLRFVLKVSWLGKSFSVYALLLLPFLIVNGVLTGTGLEQPVVIYNNAENLRIRILTIPVEDVIYGYELIVLHLFFYSKLTDNRPSENKTGQQLFFLGIPKREKAGRT